MKMPTLIIEFILKYFKNIHKNYNIYTNKNKYKWNLFLNISLLTIYSPSQLNLLSIIMGRPTVRPLADAFHFWYERYLLFILALVSIRWSLGAPTATRLTSWRILRAKKPLLVLKPLERGFADWNSAHWSELKKYH